MRFISHFLVTVSMLLSLSLSLQASSQLDELSRSPQWEKLLHFSKDWKGTWRSEIDAGDFFTSPQGSTDPLAELVSSLNLALNKERVYGPRNQIFWCAFPARIEFFKAQGLLKDEPELDKLCTDWREFYERLKNPQAIRLVFSAAHSGNPASMFGHLFLRIRSDRTSDLLDGGVNYAANVGPDEHPLAFYYFGVFGGYRGAWSLEPYYGKVNEYIKAENRDLWEYEFDFSKQEVDFLIKHLWELETTALIDYYFFDENCAYHIMRLIEVARPQISLTDHTIYVIPGEIIKNLKDVPGLLRSVTFRPSQRKKMDYRYSLLDEDGKTKVRAVIQGENSDVSLLNFRELESLSSYFDFRRQLMKGKISELEKESWSRVRSARAQISEKSNEDLSEVLSHDSRPDLGHDGYAALLGIGQYSVGSSAHTYQILRLRSAYHDLMNNDFGFKRGSEILFPWMEAHYLNSSQSLQLEEIGFIRAVSLSPITDLHKTYSWRQALGISTPKDLGCGYCKHSYWETSYGSAFEFFDESLLTYQFATLRLEGSSSLDLGYRALPGVEFAFIWTASKASKLMLMMNAHRDIGRDRVNDWISQQSIQGAYYLGQNQEIRLNAERTDKFKADSPAHFDLQLLFAQHFR